jgi:hypothetical protein
VWFFSCVVVVSTLALAPAGHASTITVMYDGSVDAASRVDFNFAAAAWIGALPSNRIGLTLHVTSTNIGTPDKAGNTIYNTIDASGFVSDATIQLNSNAVFFFDPTPGDNSEFSMLRSAINRNAASPDTIESGFVGAATLAAAMGVWDALSVDEHEIGHALGIGFNGGDPAGYTLYSTEVTANGNNINVDGVFAALFPSHVLPILQIPTIGSHFNGGIDAGFNTTLMAVPGFQLGQRSLITCVDVLGVGSVYDLEDTEVSLGCQVPAPGSLALLGVGVIAMLGVSWAARTLRNCPSSRLGA